MIFKVILLPIFCRIMTTEQHLFDIIEDIKEQAIEKTREELLIGSEHIKDLLKHEEKTLYKIIEIIKIINGLKTELQLAEKKKDYYEERLKDIRDDEISEKIYEQKNKIVCLTAALNAEVSNKECYEKDVKKIVVGLINICNLNLIK